MKLFIVVLLPSLCFGLMCYHCGDGGNGMQKGSQGLISSSDNLCKGKLLERECVSDNSTAGGAVALKAQEIGEDWNCFEFQQIEGNTILAVKGCVFSTYAKVGFKKTTTGCDKNINTLLLGKGDFCLCKKDKCNDELKSGVPASPVTLSRAAYFITTIGFLSLVY